MRETNPEDEDNPSDRNFSNFNMNVNLNLSNFCSLPNLSTLFISIFRFLSSLNFLSFQTLFLSISVVHQVIFQVRIDSFSFVINHSPPPPSMHLPIMLLPLISHCIKTYVRTYSNTFSVIQSVPLKKALRPKTILWKIMLQKFCDSRPCALLLIYSLDEPGRGQEFRSYPDQSGL